MDIKENKANYGVGRKNFFGSAKVRFSFTNHKAAIKALLIVATILVFAALAGLAGYSTWKLWRIRDPVYQRQLNEKKIKDMVMEVGSLIQLPEGLPQISTVVDAKSLKENHSFFADAQNGDELLLYPIKAILYRPGTHKIINVTLIHEGQLVEEPVKKDVLD